MDIDVAITRSDDVSLVRVQGIVDLATAPQLQKALDELVTRKRNVIVDLTGVRFIDSSGLSVLVMAGELLAESSDEAELRLVVTRPVIRQTLEITGLTQMFKIFDSLDDAVERV